jgi:hypothetical protein
MVLTLPFWFKMRQGKAEPAGDNTYRLTAPNLPETFISIRSSGNGSWTPVVRSSADGPELAVAEKSYHNPADAWGVAFELYRNAVVI